MSLSSPIRSPISSAISGVFERPRRVFSPSSLFAAGEQGVWYDPSDLSTLYQDAAGTTPVTAVEQPVGRMLDKSGRGNHATQTTSTSRPVLKQDAGGQYYLKFDGVDDSMVTNSIDFTATDKMTVFAGVRKLGSSSGFIAELSANSQTIPGSMYLQQFTDTKYYFRSHGTIAVQVGSPAYASPLTHVLTGRGDISGDSVTLRVNGAQVAQSTADQGTGKYGNYPIYIGRRGGTEGPFNGHIYGLIVRGAATTATRIAQTERWVNKKTGAY
jgi:hypothetical protein